jgi:hypothetical protein
MSSKLSRRHFIGASAGVAAAASLGGASSTLGRIGGGGRPTVPAGLLGLQQFSVRDATARRSIATSNRLGLTPLMGYLAARTIPPTRPTSARSCRSRADSPRSSSSSRRPA